MRTTVCVLTAAVFGTLGCAGDGNDVDDSDTPSVGIAGDVDTSTPRNNAVVLLNFGEFCTGTLISSNRVLTAAHCVARVQPNTIEVRVGVRGEIERHLVTNCWMHPNAFGTSLCGSQPAYYDGPVAYDFAIVELDSGVLAGSALPMPIALTRSTARPTNSSWAGTTVTMRGYGLPSGADIVRHFGTNRGLSAPDDLTWKLTAQGGQLPAQGDSGGPLIGDTGEIIGVVSRGDNISEATLWNAIPQASWIDPIMLPEGKPRWLGWTGETTGFGDNCPYTFNPSQYDADNDAIGDDCDAQPPASWRWGTADVTAAGSIASAFNSSGAAVTATPVGPGRVMVTMKELGQPGGNVQVVATGSSNIRCKAARWSAAAENATIDVACHDPSGKPTASSFMVLFNVGENSRQNGAYLYASWEKAVLAAASSWNSTGGTNTVTRTSQGRFRVDFPGLGANVGIHVTAVGTGPEYCGVESYGAGSAKVVCNAAGGALVDTSFSVAVSNGGPRSGVTGGHAWVNSTPMASTAFQALQPIAGQPVAAVGTWRAVADQATAVWYPYVSTNSYYPKVALTTAYGAAGVYCKVMSILQSGLHSTVSTKCFSASGSPTWNAFTQSTLEASN